MIVKLHITALSPLAFPERKPGDQFRPSQPFVPGAVIYGALGERCYTPQRFAALRCHNAYPARQDDAWVHPLPASAIQPKGQPDAPVRDALVERVCWRRQKPAALVYSPTDSQGRAWDRFDAAFYTLHDDRAGGLHTRTVEQRMLTRVAISRRSGTAADQQLYSPLVLSEVNSNERDQPTMFLGSAVLPDGDTEALAALENITHLGGRQTSGLGRVQITVEPSEPESAAAVKDRVVLLTRRFQEQAALYEQLGGDTWPIPDGTIFTINLLADTILTEQGWLPSYDLSPALLEELTSIEGLTGIKAKQLAAMVDPTVCAGWNVLWQRPKHSAPGLRKGGLFVFQAAQPLSNADCARLARLQIDGIGERRQEGYGQIRVCDTFHLRRDYERIRDR